MSEHPESQVRADNEVFLRRRIEELEEANNQLLDVQKELEAQVERLRKTLHGVKPCALDSAAVIREHLIILREINAAEHLIEIAEELARDKEGEN